MVQIIRYLPKILKKELFQVIFHVTTRCNSRCKYCFNWKNITQRKKEELSLEEIKKISKNLPAFPWFLISGGEPFLREDLPEIIETFYNNNKIKHVTLPTNGILTDLIFTKTKEILNRCRGISLTLALSLDGLKEKHDELRGIKGNFEKVIETYKRLRTIKNNKFSLKFNTVISNENYKDIDKIIEFVKKLRPDMHTLDFVRPETFWKKTELPPLNQIDNLIKKIITTYKYYGGYKNLKGHSKILGKFSYNIMIEFFNLFKRVLKEKKQVISCSASTATLALYANGNIAFCEMMPPFANLRRFNYSLKKALKSEEAIKWKKIIETKKCFCYHPCYQYVNIMLSPKINLKILLATIFKRW